MRLTEYLAEQQVPFQLVPHAPAFTAQRLAKYLGVPGHHVARAVLLFGPEGFFLAVLPATHQADLALLSSYLGGPVRLATPGEAAGLFRDCEWGVISPFGSLYGLPTLLDTRLPPDGWILLEAGTHVEAVWLSCADFERLAGAFRLDLARSNLLAGPPPAR